MSITVVVLTPFLEGHQPSYDTSASNEGFLVHRDKDVEVALWTKE